MGLDRFYCERVRLGQPAALVGDEARHLAKVRRVPLGAEVEVFDGLGTTATATVTALDRDRVTLQIKEVREAGPIASLDITLAVAIPKGDRFDWLVEKTTELGVRRLIPLISERSTVDPRATKLDRLRRAVIESCKQSRRNRLMTIDDPTSWESLVTDPVPPATRRWLAHPGTSSIAELDLIEPGSSVLVAIGPEGGFSGAEVAMALRSGWEAIHLTATILRIETAALAVAAHLLLRTSSR